MFNQTLDTMKIKVNNQIAELVVDHEEVAFYFWRSDYMYGGYPTEQIFSQGEDFSNFVSRAAKHLSATVNPNENWERLIQEAYEIDSEELAASWADHLIDYGEFS